MKSYTQSLKRATAIAMPIFVPSAAAANDTGSVRLTLTIPVQCSADTVAVDRTAKGVAMIVEEQCNNGRGYTLYLNHEPESVSAIRYDGRSITPSIEGRTVLERSSHARKHRSRIEIDTTGMTDAVIVISP